MLYRWRVDCFGSSLSQMVKNPIFYLWKVCSQAFAYFNFDILAILLIYLSSKKVIFQKKSNKFLGQGLSKAMKGLTIVGEFVES